MFQVGPHAKRLHRHNADFANESESARHHWHRALKLTRLSRVKRYLSVTSMASPYHLCYHFAFMVLLYVIIVHTIPITDVGLTNRGLRSFMMNDVPFDRLNGQTGALEDVVDLDDVVLYSESLVRHMLADDSYHHEGRTPDEHLMLLRVHRLINSIVFVQRRVAPSDCSYVAMRPLYERCYEGLDDHEVTWGNVELGNGLKIPYSDRLGGFAVELPLQLDEALEKIAELKEGGFWDRATREFAVLFAIHNAPGSYTGNVKANFDVSPYGNIHAEMQTQFLCLQPYSEQVNGTFFLGLQLCGLLVYVFLLYQLMSHIVRQPHARWRIAILVQPWTLLEIASHIFLSISIVLWTMYVYSPTRRSVNFASPHFQDILTLGAEFQDYIFYATAALLLWTIRLIQFFLAFQSKESKKLAAVVETVFTSMGYLAIIIGLIFMGFCFAGHMLFGPVEPRFNTLFGTLGTLLLWFVALSGGQREIFDLEGGPFFLFMFVIICMIIFFNMFMATVMAAHDEVVQNLQDEEDELRDAKCSAECGAMADNIPRPWNYELADTIADAIGLSAFKLDPFHDSSLTMHPNGKERIDVRGISQLMMPRPRSSSSV